MIGGGMIVAVAEWALLMVSLSLAVYYRLYGTCIDANGMKILQDSHPNEIIEFARSYSWWKVALLLVAIVALLAGVVMMNIRSGVALDHGASQWLLRHRWYSHGICSNRGAECSRGRGL